MARIRTVKPEFPQSESMGRVSRDARLLFIQLWTLSDDAGRARGTARMLAGLLFPYDEDAPPLIEGWLAELEREGCIRRYQVRGNSYLQITHWERHQKIDKRTPSKIPPPPGERSQAGEDARANPREDSPRDHGSWIKDHGEDQGEDQGGDRGEEGAHEPAQPSRSAAQPGAGACSESAHASSLPAAGYTMPTPFIQLPTHDGSAWSVHQDLVDDWQKLYPRIDVAQTLRGMRAWLDANPGRRKAARSMKNFVVNWLQRDEKAAPSGARGAAGHGPRGTSPPNLSGDAALAAQIARLTAAAGAANDEEVRHAQG